MSYCAQNQASSNWFLFNYFSVTWLFFPTCDLQLWKRTLHHLSYCDKSTRGTNWKYYLKQDLFIAALWSPAGKGLTTWLSFVMLNSVFVIFLCGILGQVWYLIVSIPDLCPFIT